MVPAIVVTSYTFVDRKPIIFVLAGAVCSKENASLDPLEVLPLPETSIGFSGVPGAEEPLTVRLNVPTNQRE